MAADIPGGHIDGRHCVSAEESGTRSTFIQELGGDVDGSRDNGQAAGYAGGTEARIAGT